jgi:hypothetical protein
MTFWNRSSINFFFGLIKTHTTVKKLYLKSNLVFYFIKNDPVSEFVKSRILDVVQSSCIEFLENKEKTANLDHDSVFLYIGHGDEQCVFQSEGYCQGVRNAFCNSSSIGSYSSYQVIFWACFTSQWLERGQHPNWIGFKQMIGYDCRNGGERAWWRNYLNDMFRILFTIKSNRLDHKEILRYCKTSYEKIKKDKSRSHLSRLLARGFYNNFNSNGLTRR